MQNYKNFKQNKQDYIKHNQKSNIKKTQTNKQTKTKQTKQKRRYCKYFIQYFGLTFNQTLPNI